MTPQWKGICYRPEDTAYFGLRLLNDGRNIWTNPLSNPNNHSHLTQEKNNQDGVILFNSFMTTLITINNINIYNGIPWTLPRVSWWADNSPCRRAFLDRAQGKNATQYKYMLLSSVTVHLIKISCCMIIQNKNEPKSILGYLCIDLANQAMVMAVIRRLNFLIR